MTRSRLPLVTFTLVLTMMILPMSGQRPVSPTTPAPVAEVEGAGWFTALACAGCLALGIGIVMGGPATIAAALHMPGGTVAAVGCVGMCVDAVDDAFGS